jgi:hypothetical protein
LGVWGTNETECAELHRLEMTLHFTVAEPVVSSTAASDGAPHGARGGNRGYERKSLRLDNNRLERPLEFVLHVLRCPAWIYKSRGQADANFSVGEGAAPIR